MILFNFKEWLDLFEVFASKEERGLNISHFYREYLKPFAEALLNYSKKNINYLNKDQFNEINNFNSNEFNPHNIINKIGKSASIVSTVFGHPDFPTGVLNFSNVKKRSGEIIPLLKNSSGEYAFKNFNTFSDFLSFVKGHSSVAYEINTFDNFIGYLFSSRLHSVLSRIDKISKPRELLGGGEYSGEKMNFDPADHINSSKIGSNVPDKIQECLKQFFNSKALSLEKSFANYIANPNSIVNADPLTIRLKVIHYYSCKYIAEGNGEEYNIIEKLYNKFISDRNEKNKDSSRLYKQIFNFDLNKIDNSDISDSGMQSYIHRNFDSGDPIAILGLKCTAIAFYKQFISCSGDSMPDKSILQILPEKHGIKSFINENKDKIPCRKSSKIIPFDRTLAQASDDIKMKFILKLLFDLKWPSMSTMTPYHVAFNKDIITNLEICLRNMAEDIESDNTEEDL